MSRSRPYTFEICVETADALSPAAAIADRIELCVGLDVGGLTPDHGLMNRAADLGIETHVLIRGRSGDFEMSRDDIETACANIRLTRTLGLHGVVIGAERGGQLDLDALRCMADAAAGLDLTLHRVIDVVNDPARALEEVIDLGFVRVLSSGGAASAPSGHEGLRRLHDLAQGRIEIMAGGGINSGNLRDLMTATPITSFHASCTRTVPLDDRYRAFGFGSRQRIFDPEEATRLASHLRDTTGSDVT